MCNIIILDLDNTLIHAIHNYKIMKSDFNFGLYSIYKRPYLEEFIDYCFKNYDHVIIWSSGIETYVNTIINNIFKNEPLLILTRNNCDKYGKLYWKDTNKLKYLLKPHGINYKKSNIIFIDDKTHLIKNKRKNIKLVKIEPFYILGKYYKDKELKKLFKKHII